MLAMMGRLGASLATVWVYWVAVLAALGGLVVVFCCGLGVATGTPCLPPPAPHPTPRLEAKL